jgi:CheY-like chemotaxis protein
MAKQVLSVGNCDFDNGKLACLFEGAYQAKLLIAEDLTAATRLLSKQPISLVVVNRKLDHDGSDGLEVIRALKSSPEYGSVPVMLITNYPEYDAQAIGIGAEPGFGKASLHSEQTKDRLGKFLL